MKYKIIGTGIAFVFLLGVIASALIWTAQPKQIARIVKNGKTLYTVDLRTAEDGEIVIKDGDGSNTVEIKDHKIRVKEANCPDRTCVRMGWLSSSAMPIVCLPHQLVIEFTDGDELDAVTR